MRKPLKLPTTFGKFLDQLNEAGVETASARAFWGGVTPDGEIVVTSWTDSNDGNGCFYIWRPNTNHGGLRTAWEVGNIRPGAMVRLILLRQRGNVSYGQNKRSVAGAALMPGKWRVAKMMPGHPKTGDALVEPV